MWREREKSCSESLTQRKQEERRWGVLPHGGFLGQCRGRGLQRTPSLPRAEDRGCHPYPSPGTGEVSGVLNCHLTLLEAMVNPSFPCQEFQGGEWCGGGGKPWGFWSRGRVTWVHQASQSGPGEAAVCKGDGLSVAYRLFASEPLGFSGMKCPFPTMVPSPIKRGPK